MGNEDFSFLMVVLFLAVIQLSTVTFTVVRFGPIDGMNQYENSRGGNRLTEKQQQMVALFEKHVGAELEGDLETTMATMSDVPHLHNIPTMIGGVGQSGVRKFYRDHLVGKFFPAPRLLSASATAGLFFMFLSFCLPRAELMITYQLSRSCRSLFGIPEQIVINVQRRAHQAPPGLHAMHQIIHQMMP